MTAFFATIAISIAAPDKGAMMTKEKAAWQSFKDKKTDEFTKLLSPHFMAVYADGIQTKQQEIDSMKKWDMKSCKHGTRDLPGAGGSHRGRQRRLRDLQRRVDLANEEWRMAPDLSHQHKTGGSSETIIGPL